MKAHLKTLDKAGIQAPLLREFLHKGLRSASIVSINEKISQLHEQIRVLSVMREDLTVTERPKDAWDEI